MHTAQRRFLILACAAACSSAADAPALVSRIREHMREYIAHLPDYTCRITLERFKRLKSRAPFDLGDRLRLEVAYTGGQELYSWPGDARFETGIDDLLPGHGMVSNGSYALHIRNLFLRDVAEFAAPRDEKCEGRPCVRLDFHIPAVRSGYALSAGTAARLRRWWGRPGLIPPVSTSSRLEVRVDDAPRSVRIAVHARDHGVHARPNRRRGVRSAGSVRVAAARSRRQRVAESFALRAIPPLCGKLHGIVRPHRPIPRRPPPHPRQCPQHGRRWMPASAKTQPSATGSR